MPRRKWLDDEEDKKKNVPKVEDPPPPQPRSFDGPVHHDRQTLLYEAARRADERRQKEYQHETAMRKSIRDNEPHEMSNLERTRRIVQPWEGPESIGQKVHVVKKPWVGDACSEQFDRYMLCVQDSVDPRTQCGIFKDIIINCKMQYLNKFEIDSKWGWCKSYMQWTPWGGRSPYHDEFDYSFKTTYKRN